MTKLQNFNEKTKNKTHADSIFQIHLLQNKLPRIARQSLYLKKHSLAHFINYDVIVSFADWHFHWCLIILVAAQINNLVCVRLIIRKCYLSIKVINNFILYKKKKFSKVLKINVCKQITYVKISIFKSLILYLIKMILHYD